LKWVLIVLAIILLILLVVIISKLKVYIDYYHGQDNDHLEIRFKALFGLVRYKMTIPIIKVDENSPTIVVKDKIEKGKKDKNVKQGKRQVAGEDLLKSFNDTKQIVNHVLGLHKIVKKFLRKVQVKELEWHSVVGVGDAAITGVLTGSIWAVKGSLLGIVSRYMVIKKMPIVTITPNFQFAVSQTAIKCMIQFRIGHAMLAGIKLLKFWKGGKPRFKTKPLSILSDNKSKSV